MSFQMPSTHRLAIGPRELRQSTGSLQLAAMGRLAPQKGFDLLIDAFARAAEDKPNWSLSILGEGPERRRLEEQIHERGLEGRVRLLRLGIRSGNGGRCGIAMRSCCRRDSKDFPTRCSRPWRSGCRRSPSIVPLAQPKSSGHEVDGLLVPAGDVSALTAAIRRLLSDDQLRADWERRRTVSSTDSAANATSRIGRQSS